MKHGLIITTLLATALTVSAQEEGRNMAAIGFGASHDSWNIELDYDYMVFPYAGIGIGAQFDRENGDGGLLGEIIREELRGDDYYDDYDDEHEIKLNIVPHLTLRTPAIRLKKTQDKGDGLLLEVQPAVVISLPQRPRSLFNWRTRMALGYRSGPGTLLLGYDLSNYNIYKGTTRYDNHHSTLTHAYFLSFSYSF